MRLFRSRAIRQGCALLSFMTSVALPFASAQVLEFESGGLKYQAQTRQGITVMVAPLPTRILGYAIIQVGVSNGSVEPQMIAPEGFIFHRMTPAPATVKALSARAVVGDVLNRAGRNDVGRLIGVYEAALFGNSNLELRHGYEARRKDAMAVGSTRMRAAAAAAAIVMGSRTLESGQSMDGAVFFPNSNKALGAGRLRVEIAGETFEFVLEAEPVVTR
ncbi:MAG: hypothetical protein ABI811_14445 [Acidobacteriota bacterium]